MKIIFMFDGSWKIKSNCDVYPCSSIMGGTSFLLPTESDYFPSLGKFHHLAK